MKLTEIELDILIEKIDDRLFNMSCGKDFTTQDNIEEEILMFKEIKVSLLVLKQLLKKD